jgi:hypothetical protein
LKKLTTRRSYSRGRAVIPPVCEASGISQIRFGWPPQRRIDVAEVNGRMFLNKVSLGIYGDTVRQGQ